MELRPPGVDVSGVAFDARGLDALKGQARSDPKAALAKAVTQFEALFLQQVLKQMRDALPQDGMLSSETTKSYTALFDQQLAQSLATRGMGLRKALEAQLLRGLNAGPAPDATKAEGKGGALSAPNAVLAPPPAPAAPPAKAAAPTIRGGSSVPDAVQAFIEKLRPAAEAAAASIGVPAPLLIAQAGLETGWGRSLPGGDSNNLFGVKAGGNYAGPSVAAATTEFVNGAAARVVDRFRAYASVADSLRDFGNLMRGARYATARANVNDPAAYARSLQQAGYATDPNYADKLTRAIGLVSRHFGFASPTQVLAGTADKRLSKA